MNYATALPNPFIDEQKAFVAELRRATKTVSAETARRKMKRNAKVVAKKRAAR